ncbi:hypothetical protein ACIRPX_27605, partial [Streptomyces sp. NPDC101225]
MFPRSRARRYAWVKQNQPRVWERVERAVRDGNRAPVGSMWLGPDANMPGGGALARQIVHGMRFFAEQLGVETEEFWLPGSCGRAAAFPQRAKLAGIRWFLTQKPSWNRSDTIPHHTFCGRASTARAPPARPGRGGGALRVPGRGDGRAGTAAGPPPPAPRGGGPGPGSDTPGRGARGDNPAPPPHTPPGA